MYKDNCSDIHVEMHKSMYTRHPYVSSVIDAVLAYTTSIQALYKSKCPSMRQSSFCDQLREVHEQQVLSHIK